LPRVLAGDGDLELCGHVAVEPHGDGEFADRLDGLVHRDAATLDLDPVLRKERGDIRLADGAEQAALVGGLPGLGEVQRLDGPRLFLRLGRELRRRRVLAQLDLLEVLEVRRRRVERQLVRQKVVAGVSV
jgi:hypothetical protein